MLVLADILEESLDIAVVIPSYAEGNGIVSALSSLAQQKDVQRLDYAVFVVVNNTASAAQNVLDSNEETLQVLLALKRGRFPCGGFGHMDAAMFDNYISGIVGVIEGKLRMCVVDLGSCGHAPAECNVGIARDIGAEVASKYLKDDGLLVMTDADTCLCDDYLSLVEKIFRRDDNLAAATGNMFIDCPSFADEDIQNAFRLQDIELYWKDACASLSRYFHLDSIGNQSGEVIMSGSNMVVRKCVFEAVGGVPRISGAEDSVFSFRILDAGFKIGYFERLHFHTAFRPSTRTAQDAGYGHVVKKFIDHGRDHGAFEVFLPEVAIVVENLLAHIDLANSRAGDKPDDWKMIVYESEDMFFSKEELDALWEKNRLAPEWMSSVQNSPLRLLLEKIVGESFGKVSFDKATDWLMNFCREESDLFGLMEQILDMHIARVRDLPGYGAISAERREVDELDVKNLIFYGRVHCLNVFGNLCSISQKLAKVRVDIEHLLLCPEVNFLRDDLEFFNSKLSALLAFFQYYFSANLIAALQGCLESMPVVNVFVPLKAYEGMESLYAGLLADATSFLENTGIEERGFGKLADFRASGIEGIDSRIESVCDFLELVAGYVDALRRMGQRTVAYRAAQNSA